MSFLKNFFVEEDGQDMVEYGLIIGLVVLAAVGAFMGLSTTLNTGIAATGTEIGAAMKSTR